MTWTYKPHFNSNDTNTIKCQERGRLYQKITMMFEIVISHLNIEHEKLYLGLRSKPLLILFSF